MVLSKKFAETLLSATISAMKLVRQRRHLVRGVKGASKGLKKEERAVQSKNVEDLDRQIKREHKKISEAVEGEGLVKGVVKFTGELERDIQQHIRILAEASKRGFPPAQIERAKRELMPLIQMLIQELGEERGLIADEEAQARQLLNELGAA